MKKQILLVVLLALFPLIVLSQTFNTDSILNVLYKEIQNKESYYKTREDKILDLKRQSLNENHDYNSFLINNQIFDEYSSFQYDSAFVYANKLVNLSEKIANKDLKVKARCNVFSCFVKTGLFKEAFDYAESINTEQTTDSIKNYYYTLCSKLYSSIKNYNKGYLQSEDYERLRKKYCDSTLMTLSTRSLEYNYTLIIKNLNNSTPEKKIAAYKKLLQDYNIDDHLKAIIYSSIGKTYKYMGNASNAIYYMSLSAIHDIKSATRETTSKTLLATYLYEEGNIEGASKLIDEALADANFYNARHHKISINSILPIIEKERAEMIEKQKNMLIIFSVIVSIILLALLFAFFTIYKQIKSLRTAKNTIQEQYDRLEAVNGELNEANEIKDQYIIQSLYGKSEYIEKVEGLLLKIDRKLKSKQYDDILRMNSEFEIKKERENLFSSFDTTFFKIFPNFIEEYNKLFNEEDHIAILDNNLPPEVRIFALIRLGINENERISKFLNLSINTIYSYKAKVKNKSIVPNEEFEYLIMQIKK